MKRASTRWSRRRSDDACAFSFRAMPARLRSAPMKWRWRWSRPPASAASPSRSSEPARAGCIGWSRWSRSQRRKGRVAFGPVTEADVAVRARRDDRRRCRMPLRLGVADEIPWLKRQTRLTFARCGVIDPRSLEDYRAHDGYKGLERALTLGIGRDPRRCHGVRTARPRRRRISDRHQVENRGADQRRPEIHRLQRRRRRQRHVRRPHDHGRRSLRGDRGHDHRRHRGRRHQGLHLHPLGISARHRGDERGDRGGQARRLSRRRASAAPRTASISKSGSAPAPMSAAKRPRCWKASKAAAASSAPSRRCRRIRACSASRP